MAEWRLAKSLETLREQINKAAPGRSKASDGAIGDSEHATRVSDHNPWVKDGSMGVVTAIDVTHDPRNGVDAAAITEALKASGDIRLKYIIWNRRIWTPSKSPNWRAYGGVNPHDKHFHISVTSEKPLYDSTRVWVWGKAVPDTAAPIVEAPPLLYEGITGQDKHIIRARGALLAAFHAEVGFGPLLDGLVRGYQKQHGLKQDGKIGSYTWSLLRP